MKPNELLRDTHNLDDPNLQGDIRVTVNLKKVAVGTEVHIQQSGLPSVIPDEACHLGWQESRTQLALLAQAQVSEGVTVSSEPGRKWADKVGAI